MHMPPPYRRQPTSHSGPVAQHPLPQPRQQALGAQECQQEEVPQVLQVGCGACPRLFGSGRGSNA